MLANQYDRKYMRIREALAHFERSNGVLAKLRKAGRVERAV